MPGHALDGEHGERSSDIDGGTIAVALRRRDANESVTGEPSDDARVHAESAADRPRSRQPAPAVRTSSRDTADTVAAFVEQTAAEFQWPEGHGTVGDIQAGGRWASRISKRRVSERDFTHATTRMLF
ncbi:MULTISPECIES: hypothetical protein [unclassified Streptomyces]|uniref:hypothetical protein n=1 Tax=Streptomyces sp. NPDC127532 TaxID=3345399 RepID=UPI0036343A20